MPLEYALQFRGRFPDPGPWKLPRSFTARLSEPLGISDLPVQRVRRSKRRPYMFNIMVVGESGLGKTTFMNTLFNAPLTEQRTPKNLSASKTVAIDPTTYELTEDGVTLMLTVIDTPGFGDQLNRETSFEPIVDYIDAQYDLYLQAESSQEMRRNIRDTRVHALLYFITPSGDNGLKELDVEFLQRLSTKVNVIPVIAKADTLTPEETSAFKKAILRDFERHDIRVYPTAHAEDRETLVDLERYMPFAVIGSDDFIDVGGKKVRGRSYRWGAVEVENDKHCDFVHLRELLIRSNLQDLIETTQTVHYSQYRSQQIREQGRPESFLACDEFYESRIENAKRSLADDMQRKEDEMRQMFVAKVREKEASLREREEALALKRQQMMEELEKIRRSIEAEESTYNEMLKAKGTQKKFMGANLLGNIGVSEATKVRISSQSRESQLNSFWSSPGGPTWPTFDFVKPRDDSAICTTGRFTIQGQPLFTQAEEDQGLGEADRLGHEAKTALTVWDCSVILAKMLEYQNTRAATAISEFDVRGKRVIELGAGRALVGMAAAVLGANVVVTDVDDVLPALKKVIALNEHIIASDKAESELSGKGRIEGVCNLDWTQRSNVISMLQPPFDLILAADVVWLYDLIEPLVATIAELSSPNTTTLLAYQSRALRADRQLFSALENHRLSWEILGDEQLDLFYRKDNVVIYRIQKRRHG
ncbi:uncharacterized protein SPPG_04107 [Spizellomyces punctatus DAOM BR117]|uniref:Septin-type G domain-containing protein n=1 Tax=Spizellomyces punctatus (strain DAOM BR117) TaxID=645134 RepID=A0A0L0HJE1_SPIPD|nr:uncharacterized protein SPPG_04107 [Spizellomyces punctatus DAOM BR117]KND01015.1 hypothetical protein SPPG_04107 [Spizellomyces punctatus DAOM BR117]|eukprot:XP_016609054.1 hypothetical protein SPPG_04107 [Spizellomyces punctatus DAOM BR117]